MTDNQLLATLVKIRRQLHENPELGFKEFKTAALIHKHLRVLAIPFETIAETGTIAILQKGEGPTIVLRADMDALPIVEDTGYEFSSVNEGVMHACGHDLHITMLLGAAHLLKDKDFKGTIKFVFQPSEEGNARSPEKGKSGGQIIVESGKLDDAKASLGLHVHPLLPLGKLGFKNGEALANVSNFTIQINGKGGHPGAMEHLTDPVLISAHLIVAVQSLISHTAPIEPAIIAFTHVQSMAEPSFNVIPQSVVMQGSIRVLNIDTYKKIISKLKDLIKGIEISYGCQIDLNFSAYYPSLLNDPVIHEKLAAAQDKVFGKANLIEVTGQLIAEDFAFYSRLMPSQFYFLGAQTAENSEYFLHHPKVTFSEECIPFGVAYLTEGALDLISSFS